MCLTREERALQLHRASSDGKMHGPGYTAAACRLRHLVPGTHAGVLSVRPPNAEQWRAQSTRWLGSPSEDARTWGVAGWSLRSKVRVRRLSVGAWFRCGARAPNDSAMDRTLLGVRGITLQPLWGETEERPGRYGTGRTR